MSNVTITLPMAAVKVAAEAIIDVTFRDEFTVCRNLDTLVAECGGGCEDEMAFLRAARDAGVDIEALVVERARRHAPIEEGGE